MVQGSVPGNKSKTIEVVVDSALLMNKSRNNSVKTFITLQTFIRCTLQHQRIVSIDIEMGEFRDITGI